MEAMDNLFKLTTLGNLDYPMRLMTQASADEAQRMRHALYETYLKRKLISAADIFYDEIVKILPSEESKELLSYVGKLEKVINKKYNAE